MAQKSTAKAKPKTSNKNDSSAKTSKPSKASSSVKEGAKAKAREKVLEASPSSEVEAPPKKEKKSAAAVKAAAAAAAALNEEQKKWAELKEKFGSEKASTYSMSGVYSSQTPLTHKVLGWGFVLSNVNDRLEVLFESGKKVLISNYKSG